MTGIHLETEYVPVNCGPSDSGGCGTPFAMTRSFYDEMKRTGATWHCPRGHARVYRRGKSDEQKLAEAKAREIALQDQLAAAVREAEVVRASLLRDRARFANGVCPCCNRSFENVRRHMRGQHPDYDVTKLDTEMPKMFACSCGRKFESLRGLRTHQGHQRPARLGGCDLGLVAAPDEGLASPP